MWARAAIGHSSPVTLEAAVTTSSFGPSIPASASSAARTASPGKAGGASRTAWGQGSREAWCSVSKTTAVVPAGRQPASRFVASVVLRVKITASSGRAPTNALTVWRACSYLAVVSCEA
ncbi:hypothetical protein GCM10020220_113870 [Nonomuraea rubra]